MPYIAHRVVWLLVEWSVTGLSWSSILPERLKVQMDLAIICIVSLLLISHASCDDSPANKWTCSCASVHQENQTIPVVANCSSSCDCSPEIVAGGVSRDTWTCLCGTERLDKGPGSIAGSGCFSACNCTSGPFGEQETQKKHHSSKTIVYILLLSVLVTALAFLASLGCYFYKRNKRLVGTPIFSPDKDLSFNSAMNQTSHASSLLPEFIVEKTCPTNSFTGWIQRASFLFRSKKGIIPGAIAQYTFFELEVATNKFSSSNLIGLGGSSHVYRGQLKDGKMVAVKRLKFPGGPEADSLFIIEIELLSRLHHCHVVRLLGYCSESQGRHAERLLVFEYMENGNLRDCLDGIEGKELMDWSSRVSIALGAARGLEYLHEAAAPRILHRDVKSTNILLDDTWRAKITDLGMAKHIRTDDLPSCTNSPARMQGTFGYFAPEYAIVGRASLKSDIFSFGVVILELITGRQPIQKSPNKGEESLVIWATPRLQDSKRVISELPDPHLKDDFPKDEMQIMAYLAKECLLLDPDSRPSMSEVVQILSTIAPENSRRRNFPGNFYQSSSTYDMRRAVETIKYMQEDTNGPNDTVNQSGVLCRGQSARCSWPTTVDRKVCIEDGIIKHGDTVLSAEYIERLILLTSKARSWRATMDETVDITEPRFETFLQPNVHSL